MAKLLVDLSRIRCRAVRDCVDLLGERRNSDDDSVNLIWTDNYLRLDVFLTKLKPTASVNKIPMVDILCYKTNFFKALSRLPALPKGVYKFFPLTYVLPDEINKFAKAIETHETSGPWIVKPATGMCGYAIEVVHTLEKMKQFSEAAVVQDYLRPFLLNPGAGRDRVAGFKFDLRLHVLVSVSADLSISIFLYEDGLARFCTHPYHEAAPGKPFDKFGHLTNVSVNSKNPEASPMEFMTVQDVLKFIREDHKKGVTGTPNPTTLWDEIEKLVLLSITAQFRSMQEWVNWVRSRTASGRNAGDDQEPPFFQLLGIDVMIAHDGHPFVLELNDRPSLFVTNQEVEGPLKHRMLAKALLVLFPDLTSLPADKDASGDYNWIQLYPSSPQSRNVARTLKLNKAYTRFVDNVVKLDLPDYPTKPKGLRGSNLEEMAWSKFCSPGNGSKYRDLLDSVGELSLPEAPEAVSPFYFNVDGDKIHRLDERLPDLLPDELPSGAASFAFVPRRCCKMQFDLPRKWILDYLVLIRSGGFVAVHAHGRKLYGCVKRHHLPSGETCDMIAYPGTGQDPMDGRLQLRVWIEDIDRCTFLQVGIKKKEV
jgi:hypothetical protein